MNKREFIKTGLVAGGMAVLAKRTSSLKLPGHTTRFYAGHWKLENPSVEETSDEAMQRYEKYRKAGIAGIFFGGESEKHFEAARQNGIAVHRWMWTTNRPDEQLIREHPEWFAISRSGKSCATDPPYVDYYRWLCPSKPEVHDYLADQAVKLLDDEYSEGLHLDYVRYCDVILPVNLWEKYDIVQKVELPEYDFCYCSTCRENYAEKHNIDPLELEFPSQSISWRNYRYDQVTRVVKKIAGLVEEYNSQLSAAVFPTPEVARRIVRQDWTRWPLDAVFPMIYHGFYKENVSWIGEAVNEGIHFLANRFPLYAGLFLPDFRDKEELSAGIRFAIENGATGVSLFGQIDDEVLEVLKAI